MKNIIKNIIKKQKSTWQSSQEMVVLAFYAKKIKNELCFGRKKSNLQNKKWKKNSDANTEPLLKLIRLTFRSYSFPRRD